MEKNTIAGLGLGSILLLNSNKKQLNLNNYDYSSINKKNATEIYSEKGIGSHSKPNIYIQSPAHGEHVNFQGLEAQFGLK